MKKIISFVGIAILTFAIAHTANAAPGKKALPGNISNNITAQYPDAKIRNWSFKDNEYIVNIVEEKGRCRTWYTRDGSWVKTERHIGLTKHLPAPVRQGYNKSRYASWHIDSIKELTSPDGRTNYVMHVDDGDKLSSDKVDAERSDYLIYFGSDGMLINTAPYIFK
jgi:hypothetical protein